LVAFSIQRQRPAVRNLVAVDDLLTVSDRFDAEPAVANVQAAALELFVIKSCCASLATWRCKRARSAPGTASIRFPTRLDKALGQMRFVGHQCQDVRRRSYECSAPIQFMAICVFIEREATDWSHALGRSIGDRERIGSARHKGVRSVR